MTNININITIILPVFSFNLNQLKNSLNSILNQTFTDYNLLLVDDGNNELIKEYLLSIQDPRMKIIHNESNRGISYSMNKALSIVNDGLIFIFHSDDIYNPKRIETMLKYFKNEKIDVLGSWQRNEFNILEKLPLYNWAIRGSVAFLNPISNPSSAFRISAVKRNNLKYKPNEPSEDYLFWIELMRDRNVVFQNLKQPLLKYSKRNESIVYSIEELKQIKASSIFSLRTYIENSQIEWTEAELLNFYGFSRSLLNATDVNFSSALIFYEKIRIYLKNEFGFFKSFIIVNFYKSKAIINYSLNKRVFNIRFIKTLILYVIIKFLEIFTGKL